MQIETNIGRGDYKLVSPLGNHKTHKTIRGWRRIAKCSACHKNTDAHEILRALSKRGSVNMRGISFAVIHFLPDVPERYTLWSCWRRVLKRVNGCSCKIINWSSVVLFLVANHITQCIKFSKCLGKMGKVNKIQ
jgi:hypothetical protein